MHLTTGQLEKLSELFLDIAKGLLLASAAVPVFSSEITFLSSMKSVGVGLLFTFLSLKAIQLKEVMNT